MEETSDLPEMQTRQPSLSPKRSSPIPITSAETAKRSAKIAKPSLVRSSGPPALGRASALNSSSARLNVSQNAANSLALVRRNSTGGIGGKRQVISSSVPKGKIASSNVEPRMRRSVTSGKQVSFGSTTTRQSNSSVSSSSDLKKQSPISPVSRTNFRMSKGDTTVSKQDTVRKATVVSTTKRMPSLSLDSHSGGGSSSSSTGSTLRKSGSKVSSPSVSSSGGSRFGSLSTSVDKGSSLLGRKKVADSRDSRLIMLPQVELKAGDDVRLDLRGHRVCSLNGSGLNLTPNLEFVYLRDNLLSSVEGIEVLKRVKVLDLSFNELKGPGFEPLENCKSLQQLYLAGNKITSLESLPQLPYLEFLSVAQNRLKSLSMATQPRLKVLAASKNKISTLKGFPHLPLLEHLRVEENPILEMPHVEAASILLIGPTLKRFNDRDLSGKEIDIAKRYPAHTFQCIRDGWEFCRPEAAVDSTFRFLLDKWKDDLPPGYILEEVSVDHPYEEDACHCHFNFSKDRTLSTDLELILNYQWFIGEKTPTNFLPIADAVGETYWPKREDIDKFLKVECTPILGEALYLSIFAVSSPVSAGTGFPKVLNLSVNGELVEGNVIKGSAEVAWCGGTPGKCVASWLRRRWNSTPVVVIGAEDEEYLLTLDDIDSSLVFMYTPVTEEGAKGEPQYAMTDFVKAAPPAVSNVQILGDIVEGNTIKGQGEYFGGKEGPSKFEWLRVNNDTGDFILVSTGTAEYTLTKEDVGHLLVFVYIPINFEGQEGKSSKIVSQIVKQAPPKVNNLKIVGELREGNKVTVTALVTGGIEGSSRVQWFKTSSSKLEGETALEALSTPKIAKAFRIPLGAVGHYIVAKFTPMTPDGESGEPAYLVSAKAVETLPPSLNFLSVTGDYLEGEMLTASYGYIGGHEGKSDYNWYLHKVEADPGALIPEASGYLQYRITKDAIGKYISFKCTPVRDDGIWGEPRTLTGQERVRPGNPKLLTLRLLGKAIEGTTLHVDKKYWGGEEGDSVFRWFLADSDGTQSEIISANAASYTLSSDDIGLLISVACEPVRSDLARGLSVLSEKIGPVIPGPPTCQSLQFLGSIMEGQKLVFDATYTGGERGTCSHEWFRMSCNGVKEKLSDDDYLNLTVDDVGSCIELIYTPMRKDGVKGAPKHVVSEIVPPAEPTCLELIIPYCCEDIEVFPKKSYYGGKEGNGEYVWYKTKAKMQGSDLTNVSNLCEDVFVCGRSLTYTPSLEDVGSYLVLYWVPTRTDRKCGEPSVAISSEPVSPAHPIVSNVHVEELSSGIYSGGGNYYGGHEGSSLFSWYRETKEGTIVLISGASSTVYEVDDSDYTCRLLFGYTPVRSDSAVGELRLSESTGIILPELLQVEMLTFTGKAVEGEKLTAVEVISNSEVQQRVWSEYKKVIKYQWFLSTDAGDDKPFEPLPLQQSSSYKVRMEDIGCCLKCQSIVTDVFGRSSKPMVAETAPVLPGIPKIDKLEIEGRGFHTNLYAIRGIYSGGKEGKSRVQWLRSMVGSPDLISIPGEIGRIYEANVDDVGYRLVAVYTPIREDGVEGQPVSASTEPIAVEPDVLKEVKQKLDLGSVKFEALCDKDRSPRKVPGVGSLERRILEVNRKRVKVLKPGSKTSFPATEIRGTYTPPFHVELFRNDQHRLRIVVDSENEVDLMVQTRHLRDVIVLVIRGLAQKFNSTSLNSLLKIET